MVDLTDALAEEAGRLPEGDPDRLRLGDAVPET